MLQMQDRNCLISCRELQQLIQEGDPAPVVIAIQPFWGYGLRRIPGSLQVTRRRLRDPHTHKLIEPSLFQRWARSLGLHSGSRLVLVDERYDATWLWWAFRRYGHSRVQVLDSGLPEWRRLGGPMDRGIPFPRSRHAAGTWTAARTVNFRLLIRFRCLRPSMTPPSIFGIPVRKRSGVEPSVCVVLPVPGGFPGPTISLGMSSGITTAVVQPSNPRLMWPR